MICRIENLLGPSENVSVWSMYHRMFKVQDFSILKSQKGKLMVHGLDNE